MEKLSSPSTHAVVFNPQISSFNSPCRPTVPLTSFNAHVKFVHPIACGVEDRSAPKKGVGGVVDQNTHLSCEISIVGFVPYSQLGMSVFIVIDLQSIGPCTETNLKPLLAACEEGGHVVEGWDLQGANKPSAS